MAHDVTKVLLGNGLSSAKEVSVFNSDPATYLAGLAVSQSSTVDALSLLKSAGQRCGISLGKSLSDTKKTAVARSGLGIPLRAHLKRSTGTVTITNVANLLSGAADTITVGATGFVAQAGAATLGQATFQASGTTAQTATSLATQINAHATASTLVYAVAASAVVTLYAIVEGAGTGHDVALSYTNGDANVGATLAGLSGGKLSGGSNTIADIAYQAVGAKVYINDATGKADIAMSGFSTISDAMYALNGIELTGIDESGSEVSACLVDMPGGL